MPSTIQRSAFDSLETFDTPSDGNQSRTIVPNQYLRLEVEKQALATAASNYSSLEQVGLHKPSPFGPAIKV